MTLPDPYVRDDLMVLYFSVADEDPPLGARVYCGHEPDPDSLSTFRPMVTVLCSFLSQRHQNASVATQVALQAKQQIDAMPFINPRLMYLSAAQVRALVGLAMGDDFRGVHSHTRGALSTRRLIRMPSRHADWRHPENWELTDLGRQIGEWHAYRQALRFIDLHSLDDLPPNMNIC